MSAAEPTGSGRRRAVRSDAGKVQATARDIAGLSWVVEMYGMPLDLLMEFLGVSSESAARNMLGRWRRAGWVETRRLGDPLVTWAWATSSGVEMFGRRGYAATQPSLGRLAHHRAVIEVRLYLERELADKSPEWTSERELRWQLGSAKGANGQREHVADGLIEFDSSAGGRGTWVIEAELSTKSVQRTVSILDTLATQYKRDERIAYYVTDRTRPLVERALAEYATRNARQAGRFEIADMPGGER